VAGPSRKSETFRNRALKPGSPPGRLSFAPILTLAALLILIQLDLALGFSLLSMWQLAVCLGLTLTLAMLGRGPLGRSGRTRTIFLAGVILAITLLGIALAYHFSSRRSIASETQGSTQRLTDRAGRIEREFQQFLQDLAAPAAEISKEFPLERTARFERLAELLSRIPSDQQRYGWTLWQNGAPDSWAGRTALSEAGVPVPTRTSLSIVAKGASVLLVASTPVRKLWTLTSEYLLQSPLESTPLLGLPSVRKGVDGDSVQLGSLSAILPPGGAPDLESSRAGRSRHGIAPGQTTLYLPLRDSAGNTLIVLTLRDRLPEASLLQSRGTYQVLGIVLSCLAFLAFSLVCFRAAVSREGGAVLLPFASGLALLAAARMVLFPIGWVLHERDLFGSRLFGCTIAAPLFRSPADCFITALLISLLAGWGRRLLDPSRGLRPRRGLILGLGLPVVAGSGILLLRFAAEIPEDARFDVTRVVFFPFDWPRLLVQSSLCLLFGSWLYLTMAWVASLRKKPSPSLAMLGPQPFHPARSSAFVAFSVLLFLPLLLRESLHQKEDFFRKTLLPDVENQEANRERILREVLEDLSSSSQARRILANAESISAEGTAYRLWSITRLKREGLSSALRLFAPDGRLLGTFGLNLPAEPEFEQLPRVPLSQVKHLLLTMGGLRRRVLAGEVELPGSANATYHAQVYLLDESENLFFIRSANPDIRLFQASFPRETNPELIASEPLLAFFDARGRLLECNLEGGTLLPRGSLERLGQARPRWTHAQVGDERYRALASREPNGFVILGFLLPTTLQVIGSFVRFTLLGLALSAAATGILALLAGGGGWKLLPPSGYSRRLLLGFLAASLLPLFALAIFLHQFASRQFQESLLSQGLSSLGAAGRIVEDYLTASEEGEVSIDDGVAYWISRVVDQDVNLYRGETLSSSSTRELYSSGLLPTRMEAAVYRELILEGRPFSLSRRGVESLDTLTISAPLSPADPSSGILSLPLSLKERENRRKRADVDEAILIVTVSMLLLLSALSDYLARRVSRPITALSQAAGRIEAGDYDAEVRLRAKDEPALLIESFNRMAASLRRQREDLRRRGDYIGKILLNATTGVISTDASERIVTLNPAARFLLGLTTTPGTGSILTQVLGDSAALAPLSRALADSPPEREARWQVELPLGDRPATLRVASLPFRETPEAPPGRILLLEDVSEAVRSSRLEAWAEMARRIAHEIKNPLTPIQLSADHLRKVYHSADPRFAEILEQCLDTIQKQVRSLRSIAGDFSDYARIPVLAPQRLPTRELLDEVLAPYRDNPPEGLGFHLNIEPGTPDLQADPLLTRRALINLVQNAMEAMPEGGTLTVSAGPIPNSEDGGRPTVRIRVRDTGSGMDEATQSRLFEPYFSTKATGSGLGLSIVKKTTEDQGGRVRVISAPGEGTEVILDLPACES
jgi:signal transduction histidine kinase